MTSHPLPRLCILDDEDGIRRQLVSFLEDFDEFDLIAADSAEQALDLLATAPAEVCIVDMRLPGLSGAEFIHQAKNQGLARHFLLHTGSSDLTLTPALATLGLTEDDIFHKPADLLAMLQRIREMVRGGETDDVHGDSDH